MFKSVDHKRDFPKMEEDLLSWWEDNDITEKYLKRNSKKRKQFSFIDGPITANNPMGLHHAWGRMYKDLWQRYKNMQGYRQRFQNGFDCQGLWVEVEVERELGFNSKKDILDYGMDNFTNKCVARVNKFAKKQTDQSRRLGMFMDWDNSYYTMSETNNLYIWRFLKECQERNLLYKEKSATVWCPRCETGLSQHEQSDGYQVIDDVSVYVKFKVKGRDDEYFLVWTTTPWTLSANVLLAINPEHQYVKASVDGQSWYLAKESADRLGLDEYSDVDAQKLLNLEYESLYPHIDVQKDIKHWVVEWDLVDPSEGTGVVHIAPSGGAEDYELGKKVDAAIFPTLDETGRFMEGYGELTGKNANEVQEEVIEYLTEKDSLYKTETVTHSYPHCWRCKTKCLFRLEDNWFINIQQVKPLLKEQAAEAHWVPDFAGKRMQDWLDNMGDWMISRKRFYGLSLPFYECGECGELFVAGSKDELKEHAVNPERVDELPSLHRPWIDEVKVKCPKCSEEVSRIPDVGDCWLDAGVVPFSTLKYFDDRKYWEKWFPAEFICEMVEQVRLWYYSMLVYGVIFEGKVPYQNVLNYVEVRDENGERFSKSKVNYVPFDEAAEKAGSDVIRWLYATQSPGTNLRFGWNITEDVRRRFYLPLWNSYCYLVTYANQHNFEQDSLNLTELEPLDRWILAELQEMVKVMTEKLDEYDVATPSRKMETFIQDVSTWYIRRSRERFMNGDVKALGTLYTVLRTVCSLLAPVIPFMTEEMYLNLRGAEDPESVHLTDFPIVQKKYVNDKLRNQMEAVREVAALGQAARVSSGMRVRQPLSVLEVKGTSIDDSLVGLVADELNVHKVKVVTKLSQGKEWEVQESKTVQVALNTELDEKLKAEGMYRDLLRKIQQSRKEAGLQMGDPVEVVVVTQNPDMETVAKERAGELKDAVTATSVDVEASASGKSTKKRIFVTIG